MSFLNGLHPKSNFLAAIRRDRVRRDSMSWPDVFAQSYLIWTEHIGPNTGPLVRVLEKEGHTPLTVCPIDWRPRSEIKELIAGIPNGYCSLMVLHQSLEGVIPAIAQPELDVADIDGKALHFAMGDLHVNHESILPSGATAAYPGPLEWLATDQASQTGFREITFDEDGRFMRSIHIPTPSRKLVTLVAGNTLPIHLPDVMPLEDWLDSESWEAPIPGHQVEVGSPGNTMFIIGSGVGRDNAARHRYFFDIRYFHSPTGDSRQLADSISEYLKHRFEGSLARVSQIPSVDAADRYAEGVVIEGEVEGDTSALSMEEAIREHTADEEDPRIQNIALDLWANPESIQTIIDTI